MKKLVQIKARKSKRSGTNEVGVSLVELLVAIAISGFLAICLSESLSAQMRMSTLTQSRLIASQLARSTVERLRTAEFNELPPSFQQFPIKIKSEDPNGSFGLLNRPLQIDTANLLWSHVDPSNLNPGSTFTGTVQILITDSNVSDTKKIDVTITWSEPPSTIDKTYVLSSFVHRYGIHGGSR